MVIRDVSFATADDEVQSLEWPCTLRYGVDGQEIKIEFKSNTSSIRPIEFLNYITEDCGLVKGDNKSATAILSKPLFDAMALRLETSSLDEFMEKRCNMYYSEYDWIYAQEYAAHNKEMLLSLQSYKKKVIPWGYVKTTDIATEGKKITIKMLENESGLEVESDNDVYIMIGKLGEVYNISAQKFHNTYDISDEPLDIFEQMMEMIPEVIIEGEEEHTSIDLLAKKCYTKPLSLIRAKKLTRPTKIFPKGSEDYFFGRSGDYMAVRKDDIEDIYIIRGDIFEMTYEKDILSE